MPADTLFLAAIIGPVFAPDPGLLLLVVAVLDGFIGDPPGLWARIPHPVAVIGRAISALDRRLNRPERSEAERVRRGALTVILVASGTALVAWGLSDLLRSLPFGWVGEALIAMTLVAQKSLYEHVRDVADALARDGLAAGRRMVARIVGRDPESLDEAGVSRAAIESLAENFSDGVVAPLFWFAVAGLPGIAAYKAINTMDSMIGHMTPRHAAFGRVAARLDDLVNWPAARIAGGLIALAAALPGPGDAGEAMAAMRRDARRHRSPNAGWPEAAMAGALGLRLAGPRRYGNRAVDDAWMGRGDTEAGPADIDRALTLYLRACMAGAPLLALLATLLD
ncbi:adenosylcobinamide-phosphate synthase CbiB [Tistrella mobilis]|uniref:adenosylcobinamide-phosphate synthase CbiB n=1 Tax=Tistrella mobilis TaxID=171437 RepID=UPI003557706A